MIEKELLLKELQKQIHCTDNEEIKVALRSLIVDVLTGKYNVRVWE